MTPCAPTPSSDPSDRCHLDADEYRYSISSVHSFGAAEAERSLELPPPPNRFRSRFHK